MQWHRICESSGGNGPKAHGTHFLVTDEWLGSILPAELPDKYETMNVQIEHSGINVPTDAIKSQLLYLEIEGPSTGRAFASKAFCKPFHVKKAWAMLSV